VSVWGAVAKVLLHEDYLKKIFKEPTGYYIESRTRLALRKNCPEPSRVEPAETGKIVSIPQVGGLHHRYARIAAWAASSVYGTCVIVQMCF